MDTVTNTPDHLEPLADPIDVTAEVDDPVAVDAKIGAAKAERHANRPSTGTV